MAETIPDSHRDLLQTPFAILATVGRSGRPQLSVVWFLAEDGKLRISLNDSRQKMKNLMRHPAMTLFLMDFANPRRYLEIRGDAEIEPDPDYELARRVGAKYGGVDLRSRDREGQGRVAVTLRPTRIRAVDMARNPL